MKPTLPLKRSSTYGYAHHEPSAYQKCLNEQGEVLTHSPTRYSRHDAEVCDEKVKSEYGMGFLSIGSTYYRQVPPHFALDV